MGGGPPCSSPTPRVYSNSCPLSGFESNLFIFCWPLLLLPSIIPSIRDFSNESVLPIKWPKYCTFSFSISTFNEYSGLISLGWTGWISLQSKGLKSLLQHHSSKASILQCLAFFTIQLSHPYMTTGKIIALLEDAVQVKPGHGASQVAQW